MLLLGLVEVELEALSHRAFALQLLHDLLDVLCELLFASTVFLCLRVTGVVQLVELFQLVLELVDFLVGDFRIQAYPLVRSPLTSFRALLNCSRRSRSMASSSRKRSISSFSFSCSSSRMYS